MSDDPDIDLVGVAGRHRRTPAPPFEPPIPVRQLPLRGWALYESWLRFGRPHVEMATGSVDLVHCTGVIPAPSRAPMIATLHDVAWRHRPDHFTRHGVRIFERSLAEITKHARLVLCPSSATMLDAERAGIGADRLRLVPWGVEATPVTSPDRAAVRAKYSLPEEYLLFVGTLEPRKNLKRLTEAVRMTTSDLPLVVAGAQGWGDNVERGAANVHFIGFVSDSDLPALYSEASVFCYPSEREGFGMPVLEAMSYGVPVVTSRGSSTEEVAGGAAVLVDPYAVEDIAHGIDEALDRRRALVQLGMRQAARHRWSETARLTIQAYREALE